MDAVLTAAELSDLRSLAGMIVPASASYALPGADDPAIFADIVASMKFERDDIRSALSLLSRLAGGPLARLDQPARQDAVAKLRATGGTVVSVLSRHVLLCYYRDARVMRSLGLEVRPPFPLGFSVEQGDWSLLDNVKARPPFWRPVR